MIKHHLRFRNVSTINEGGEKSDYHLLEGLTRRDDVKHPFRCKFCEWEGNGHDGVLYHCLQSHGKEKATLSVASAMLSMDAETNKGKLRGLVRVSAEYLTMIEGSVQRKRAKASSIANVSTDTRAHHHLSLFSSF